MLIEKATILDRDAMQRMITRMAYQIIERNKGVHNLALVGILSRGGDLAKRIAGRIQEVEQVSVPVGVLDITPYRDDTKKNTQRQDRTEILFDYTGKTVVLVDDVMYTGRTVRAAIDGLMEHGRPESIQLAVLIDRGHRELPFRPDYIGKNVPTSKLEQVKVYVTERDGADQAVIVEAEDER